jgi:3-oxoacyl-[acyl-carrier protein] reductase
MDLGLRDKRVLVTGATKGIGRATARIFAEEGARVAITYHSAADEAEKVVAELGGPERAYATRLDLNDPESIDTAMGQILDQWGGIDVVVANAQTFVWVNPEDLLPFEQIDTDDWFRHLRANVEGHMLTVRPALAGMRERGWGRVILLSSVTARHGLYGSEVYGAAKAALNGFVRGLMWTRDGILSNVVAPGTTLTESQQNVHAEIVAHQREITPSGRLATPDDVARLIVFLGSQANGNINGEVIDTAGGY